MSKERVAVAVPAPLYQRFDYAFPVAWRGQILPGARVRVPFGRQHLTGIILDRPRPASDDRPCKPIEAVLDSEALIPRDLLALCEFAARYYQYPLGEVLAAALPGPLRRGDAAVIDYPQQLRLTEPGRAALARLPARAARLRELLLALEAAPAPRAGFKGPALARAVNAGWVIEEPVHELSSGRRETPPALTTEQAAALHQLDNQSAGFGVTLLEGVTGSGKTEIYLQRVASLVARGEQVLILAPEIGLTPQLLDRFRRRFGAAVAGFHSAMSETERAQVWLRARAGELRVVIGTRSAIFVPFARLGLIVVDEEHDVSYKQQEGFRYSARDLAIWRAQQAGVPVILGSATPSLESLHAARSGRYRHVQMKQRISATTAPAIRLIDIRTRPLTGGMSPPMLASIGQHLEAGGQVLIFLNRRGYAPALLCRDCNWTAPCKNCDARMSLHRQGKRLICHHCGAQTTPPRICASCQSENLIALGEGTERVEETLREQFPQYRLERLDSDRLRKRGELERVFTDIRSGAVRILVGTQVLAKGHDFAGLSLVGIVSADQALYGTDFRALERMGQLVTQVAGRAGRAGGAAEVILQTREPSHPMLQRLLALGYGGLCDALLAERQSVQLPPFSHLALLRAEALDATLALRFLQEARTRLGTSPSVRVGAPVTASMERRAGRYRAQLLIQSSSRAVLQKLLTAWTPLLAEMPLARKVRWSLDVDPADLF
jgi:primosomal protein N' (replication factor Y)